MQPQEQGLEGFRLSPQQRRLWNLQQKAGARPRPAQAAVLLEGELSPDRLEWVLAELVDRHEILRTAFQCLPGMAIPVQVIDEPWSPVLRRIDPEIAPEVAADRDLEAWIDRHFQEILDHPPFDLADARPLWLWLVRLGPARHLLVLALPALCADAAGLLNLVCEIARGYAGHAGDEPSQYADLAEWQNELLEDPETQTGRERWRLRAEPAAPSLEIPFATPRGGGAVPHWLRLALPPALAAGLRDLAARTGVSLRALLFAGWHTVLWRLSGQAPAVGLLCDGRRHEEIRSALGPLARALPVRLPVVAGLPLPELLAGAEKAIQEAVRWQEFLDPERWNGSAPATGFECEELPAPYTAGGLTFTVLRRHVWNEPFLVRLSCLAADASLMLEIGYDAAALTGRDALYLAERFQAVLESSLACPERNVDDLEILGESERRLLAAVNATAQPWDAGRCLHELVAEQAARNPAAPAVLFEGRSLSYGDLDAAAGRLARRLCALGVGADTLVGLCTERSLEMVVGILAVLKAGGAFVPFDPVAPRERLAFLLEDTAVPVLLTQRALAARLPASTAHTLYLDEEGAEETPAGTFLVGGAGPDHLAYVLYTSGSTGRPKGVMVTHRAACNHVLWAQETHGISSAERALQKTPLVFDVAIRELFWPLTVGACLVVARPGGHQDGAYLAELAAEHGIPVLNFVPSLLRAFLDEPAVDRCSALRRVISGGEELTPDLHERFVERLGSRATLYNQYGPTEAAVTATAWPCRQDAAGRRLPIGRPIGNVRVHVVDERLRSVPLGVPGELCVSGAGLARGYLRRPALTAERFIPDPWGGAGERLYRTGDLVRHLPDGDLEFLGRIDHQVKVRGARIELGEIEAVLLRHPAVRQAVVSVREDGPEGKRLVAYVTVRPEVAWPGVEAVRSTLADHLSDFMLPAAFVVLAELPLTPGGKVDRLALPAPEAPVAAEGGVSRPRNPVEQLLEGMWCELLGRPRVGIHESFFDLGGHSLLATQLISRIRQAFRAEISLRSVFESPTIAGLAGHLAAAGRAAAAPPIVPMPRTGPLPLSFAQQRLWFLDQLEPGNAAYNIAAALRLAGPPQHELLERALREVIRRHEALRTTFAVVLGEAAQVIGAPLEAPFPWIDLRSLPVEARQAETRRRIDEEARRPFDLARGPLVRMAFLWLADHEQVLLASLHHIVADGWSLGVLVRELVALFQAFATGRPAPLPDLPVQYADFARWQRDWLQGEVLEALLAYWREQLGGAGDVLALPTDRPRPPVQRLRGASFRFDVPAGLSAELAALSRRQSCTLFMLLLAAFQTLFLRFTQQSEIRVGTPVAGRNRIETETLIGFFVNMLVLRGDLSGDPGFAHLLGRVRETALGAHAHQDLPFELLVDALQPERDLSHTPLFQVVFALQNAPEGELELQGLALSALEVETGTAKFDLTLSLTETDAGLRGKLEYNTDLFDAATGRRLAASLLHLLGGVVRSPEARLSALPVLGEAEIHQLLRAWNDTETPRPVTCGLHDLFREQARKAPGAIALADGEARMTYGELDRLSNRLAHRLRALGVGPESLVGLCLEPSAEMIVGLLGILKAGGAYVPLDPAYPRERLAFILEDTGLRVLLTRRGLMEYLPAAGAVPVCLDHGEETLVGGEDGPLATGVSGENAAYVIYTSGSTGRPKGVVVSHGHVVRLFATTERWLGFGPEDTWTLFHSFAFDFSVWEIWGALLYGGRLVMIPFWSTRSPEAFLDLLRSEGVTVLNQTPSAFRQILRADSERKESGGLALRRVIFGGEALELQSLRPWFERHGDERPRLVNMYGITETTVHVTYREISAGDLDEVVGSLIGRPLPDLRAYVLDPRGEPVPVGVPGELHVGGAGLSRGYLRRPELTAARFVPDAWSGEPGARLYRSGDLVRHRPNGDLEYLGRIDDQVKVRGFRIELGEIESVLSSHADVAEAVVLARAQGREDKRLVAWFVPVAGRSADLAGLRRFLAERLPDYMVPAALVPLDSLPLTPHGKVDRRALPAPGRTGRARQISGEAYVAPRNPTEEILAAVWEQVLGHERVGTRDNFFALGGDSILSIRVLALARERGLVFSLQQLFQHQTIGDLAGVVDAAGASGATAGDLWRTRAFELVAEADRRRLPEGLEDAYPLTRLQAGMFYHMELVPDAPFYHHVNSFHLRVPCAPELFQRAVERAVVRHAALRTSFDFTSFGEPLQLVHTAALLRVPVCDLTGLAPAQQEREISAFVAGEERRRFDLSRPPLLRFHLHRRAEDELQLTLTLCHPILDGWSLHLVLTQILEDYLAFLDGRVPAERPAPLTSFRDFVALELESLHSQEHRSFWERRLSERQLLELPRWPFEPASGGPRIRALAIPVGETVSSGLRDLTRSLAVPLKSVLLAAHVRVLSLLGDQEDVLTGVITHGRPSVADGDQVCGLFLNTLPFRLRLIGGTWKDLVRTVFAAEQEMLPFQRYPLAVLRREGSEGALFETLFNYVHYHVVEELLQQDRLPVLGFRRTEETSFPLLVGFHLDPATGCVGGELRYDTSRFCAAQIASGAGLYERALAALAAGGAAQWRDLTSLLSAAETHQILYEWNDTSVKERSRPLHELFDEQAARTPEAVAVVCEESAWTYAELARRANQLAHRLRETGVGRGSLVAVSLERGPEMVEAVLGILKAGAAYVPVELHLPIARARWILETLRVAHLITGTAALDRARALRGALPVLSHVVCLDAGEDPGGEGICTRRDLDRQADGIPVSWSGPEDIAYIIFTSGSTGTPKGVVVRHRPVVNLIDWARDTFAFGPADRVLFVTALSFDLSVFDLFGLLATGGSVRVASARDLDEPARLVRQLCEEPITFWDSAPAALQQLAPFFPAPGPERESSALRLVFLSGDWIPVSLPDLVRASFPAARVVALGGATEATVWSNAFPVGEVERQWASIPYGRPIRNSRYHVLGSRLEPVQVGVPGDLYIGGECLAAGYAKEPALTADKFMPDPFGAPGGRLYRTGDRARHWPDGTLEFLGRVDQQVKIRGYRIELGEIESILREHPVVREAVALAREDEPGHKRLVAYVVLSGAASPAELRDFLRERLPGYMVPSALVPLAALPVTSNGKLDRRALPAPDEAVPAPAAPEAPRTPLEELLAGLWAETLRRERVGVHDSFFEFGGDSLSATQLVSRLRKITGIELPLRALFEAPSPAGVAARVEALRREGAGLATPPIERAPRGGRLPLSLAQQRLWFIDQLAPGDHAYNMPSAIRLHGTLDVTALERALTEIVRRHEILRTSFPSADDGEPVQVIAPPAPFPLPRVDLSGLPAEAGEAEARRLVSEEARRPFRLATGPLARAVLLRLEATGHVFALTLHHIVCDGWSMEVIVREVTALYEAFAGGRPSPLPELPVQYADFALWQRGWLRGEVLAAGLAYWRRQLAGLPGPLELPGARPGPGTPSYCGASLRSPLTAELRRALEELSRRERVTLFMTLLAAFATLLYRLTGRTDVVVGTDIANRSRSEIEGLIGFCMNLLTLRMNLSGPPRFRDLLGRVREVALGAYAHQDLPIDKLVEDLRPERTLGDSPLFNVLFVFQNAGGEPPRFAGLSVAPFSVDHQTSKFDLALFVLEREGTLHLSWTYRVELFEASVISNLAGQLLALLHAIVRDPDARVDVLGMLTPDAEKERIMDLKRREESSFDKFKKIKPRAVSAPQAELVRMGHLEGTDGFPLVIEPNLPGVDLVDWARESRSALDGLLARHGAILFRGFEGASVPRFEAFAQSMVTDLFGDYGDLPREKSGKVYSSTPYPQDKIILFHNESSHQHRWPLKQFFYCAKAAARGGETPIIDCRLIYRELDPETRQRFADQGLMYVRNFTPGLDVPWQEFFRTDDRSAVEEYCRGNGIEWEWHEDGGLRTRQLSPAVARHPRTGEAVFFNQIQLHHVSCLEPEVRESLRTLFPEDRLPRNVYYGDGSPIEDPVVDRICELYWQRSVGFRWQEGDTLMLDNMLVAHARNSYEGERKIVVAMGEIFEKKDLAG